MATLLATSSAAAISVSSGCQCADRTWVSDGFRLRREGPSPVCYLAEQMQVVRETRCR